MDSIEEKIDSTLDKTNKTIKKGVEDLKDEAK